MLEYNFTQLDDDFITIHSKFLISNDWNLVIDDIEKLAEKGNTDAMQLWYEFKSKGDNKQIDNIVESFEGANYNELLVMSNYHFKESEWNHLVNTYNRSKLSSDFDNMNNYDSLVYIEKALVMFENEALKLNDMIQLKHLSARIEYSEMIEDAFAEKYKNKINTKINILKREIIKKLVKTYKKEKAKNRKIKPSDKPQLFFALGRALVYYGETEKLKKLGYSFLKQLSERQIVSIKSSENFQFEPKSQPKTVGKTKSVADKLFEKVYNEVMTKDEQSLEK